MAKQHDHPTVTPQVAEAMDVIDLKKVDPIVFNLWQTGHFHNPKIEETRNVKVKELPKLTLEDQIVHEAMRSYQNFFSEQIDEESHLIHGHSAMADGEIGPATFEVMKKPRCGSPDYSLVEEARWPDACKDKLSVSWRFTRINNELARQSWTGALNSWTQAIQLGFEIKETFSQSHNIWATDSGLSGSILAWSMLAQGTCNQKAEQRYNWGVSWSMSYLWRTILHEVGHALGLGHINSRAAVMNPSITEHATPQAQDINAMLQLGYKKRTSPPPGPDPKDPPTGGGHGTFEFDGRKFLLVGIET